MGPIIIATDFSPNADRAFLRSVLLAGHGGAELLFAHALGGPDDGAASRQRRADAEQQLAALAAATTAQHHVRAGWTLLDGEPAVAIPALAAEIDARLLIVGPHDPNPIRDLLLGRLGEKLLARLTCPILFANGMAVTPYRRILLATDLSEGALHAARVASRLLAGHDSQSLWYHAFDARPFGGIAASTGSRAAADEDRAQMTSATEQQMADLAAAEGMAAVRVMAEPATTSVAAMILRTARAENADLLVAGTEGKTRAKRWLLGSVAEELLRDARCDLLLIPPADRQ